VKLSAETGQDHLAANGPTMLVLDGPILSLDPIWFARYTAILSSAQNAFQTVVVVPTGERWKPDELRWIGWEVIRFSGRIPNVSVDQNIRVS
jgi:hypothetical protein